MYNRFLVTEIFSESKQVDTKNNKYYLEANITAIGNARHRHFWDWRELSQILLAVTSDQNPRIQGSAAVRVRLHHREPSGAGDKPSNIPHPLKDETTAFASTVINGGEVEAGNVGEVVGVDGRRGHFGHFLPAFLEAEALELCDAEAALRRLLVGGGFGGGLWRSWGSGFGGLWPGFLWCVGVGFLGGHEKHWSSHWRGFCDLDV